MIYTPTEYCRAYPFCGKYVSAMTVKRRCANGQLPQGHSARKIPGAKGVWVIEVKEYVQQLNADHT